MNLPPFNPTLNYSTTSAYGLPSDFNPANFSAVMAGMPGAYSGAYPGAFPGGVAMASTLSSTMPSFAPLIPASQVVGSSAAPSVTPSSSGGSAVTS